MSTAAGVRHVLGIDLGTSSLKAVLLAHDGTIAATATRPYPIEVPRAGWAEQDPEHWWQAACAAIRALLDAARAEGAQVGAVCVGGQMHGTVLLDEQQRVLRPAIIWPDQRAGAEARAAEEVLDRAGLLPRLGGGVAAGFMLASLLWCREHEPEVWTRVAGALLPKDHLRFRLTGVIAAEPSDGSGIPAVDLFADAPGDRPGAGWCLPALRALDLPEEILPPLRRSDRPAGAVTAEAAAATGLVPGTPVLCGGSDQAMAAIGAGLLAPGTLLISISTGGQLITPLAEPLPDPRRGLRTLHHALPRTYLALTATLGAGLSFRWLREDLLADRAAGADARAIELASAAPAGAGGMLFLPYLAGERAPHLDPEMSGAFIGIRLDHGRAHIARAVLEGIACSLRHALEPLRDAGVAIERIGLAGGLAQGALMRRIVAGVLGQPVRPLETAEQSAIGAAILAAHHAGFYPSLRDACNALVHYGSPIEPEPTERARYEALYAQYRGLYPLLRETAHALRRIEDAV